MKNAQFTHIWAQQEKAQGRNGNMFFEGPRIYSYGTHYLAAMIHTDNHGRHVALVNCHKYSASTGRHLFYIRNALHGLMNYYVVPYPSTPNEPANMAHLLDVVKGAQADILKARSYNEWHRTRLNAAINDADAYAEAFNIKYTPVVIDWDAINTKEQAQKTYDAKRLASRVLKENHRRITLRNEVLQAAKGTDLLTDYTPERLLLAWRRGELVSVEGKEVNTKLLLWALEEQDNPEPSAPPSAYSYSHKTMLQRCGEVVRTTRGAEVPLADAHRIYRLWLAVKGRGWVNARTSQEGRVGHFTVDRIMPDGTLYAGCHTIHADEIAAFGQAMGWEV